jgi:hypothetical protein
MCLVDAPGLAHGGLHVGRARGQARSEESFSFPKFLSEQIAEVSSRLHIINAKTKTK